MYLLVNLPEITYIMLKLHYKVGKAPLNILYSAETPESEGFERHLTYDTSTGQVYSMARRQRRNSMESRNFVITLKCQTTQNFMSLKE